MINKGGVTYKGTPWHRDCFICAHCSKSLAGEKFTSHEEKPYCADCYSELFAKKCHKCKKAITGNCEKLLLEQISHVAVDDFDNNDAYWESGIW